MFKAMKLIGNRVNCMFLFVDKKKGKDIYMWKFKGFNNN